MKYDIVITNQCKRDIKLAKMQGKNIDIIFEVADLLSEGKRNRSLSSKGWVPFLSI